LVVVSYVFKTYLKDDSIKTESKDGVVTLTGTVADESQKSMAENTVASLPDVKSVDNELQISGEQPAEHSDMWITMKVKRIGTRCRTRCCCGHWRGFQSGRQSAYGI
jgi:osmotically-inducible protein OsmY